MLHDTVTDLLAHQFEAALCTLHLAVTRCPADTWDTPVGTWPFCKAAFHAVFFGDIYLQPTDDEAALKRQPFHLAHAADFGPYFEFMEGKPPARYGQAFVLEYMAFVREKARHALAAETAVTLAGPSGFGYRPCTRAELYVYNLRHLQHHAAQLSLRLQLDAGVHVPWVSHAWKASQGGIHPLQNSPSGMIAGCTDERGREQNIGPLLAVGTARLGMDRPRCGRCWHRQLGAHRRGDAEWSVATVALAARSRARRILEAVASVRQRGAWAV